MTIKDEKRYKDALTFLWSLKNLPPVKVFKGLPGREQRKLHAQRLNFLLDIIGHPEQEMKYVHITGTSGKGSVTAMVHSILCEAGFKTGCFFSPHITTELERIRLGNKFISPGDFADILEELKPYLTRCALESRYGVPSFFEMILAMSFLYFKKNKCQYVVLEVGVGGEYDPTNLIKNCEVAVITNVGIDHKDLLGGTKGSIARDKAGIIKSGCRFVTTEKSPAVIKIFREIAKDRGATAVSVVGSGLSIIKSNLSGTSFEYGGKKYDLALLGEHQALNAVLAIEALKGIVDDSAIAYLGLSKVRMPSRLEIVQENPLVIVDGAHNPDKMASTVNFVKRLKNRKLNLLTTLAGNKEAAHIFDKVMPLADKVFLTRFLDHKRQGADLKKLSAAAAKFTKKKMEIFIDPWQALDKALAETGKDDVLLLTGSFFLTGELRKKWHSEEDILKNRDMF
jgi:dihydrofolate synthase / folylpolyglutamate synthase